VVQDDDELQASASGEAVQRELVVLHDEVSMGHQISERTPYFLMVEEKESLARGGGGCAISLRLDCTVAPLIMRQ
jgi:hypothetical protein